MKKSKLIFILGFLVIGLIVFNNQVRSDDKVWGWPWAIGGYLMSQPPSPHALSPWYGGYGPYCPGYWHGWQGLHGYYPYGQSPYWSRYSGYYYGYPHHYYFHYPHQEQSPYSSLVVKPAGELAIMVKTPGAKVFVDGYELKQNEDFTYGLGLLTGKHQVEIIAEGYQPFSQEVDIQMAQKTSLSVELQK